MTPTPDDTWAWTPIEVPCSSCGQANPLHEQPPDELAKGVKWECNHCGAANLMGGPPVGIPTDVLLECGACSRSFSSTSAEQPTLEADGSWTCPCGTPNRTVAAGETGGGQEKAAAS